MAATDGVWRSLLLGHAHRVLSVMRQNARFARKRDPSSHSPLLDGFVELRRIVSESDDVRSLDAMSYMSPFLQVVSSEETSGLITGEALTAVRSILREDLLQPHTVHAGECVAAIAHATSNCRFELSDARSDDNVLLLMLEVLVSVAECRAGVLLQPESVSEILQTCFRLSCQQRLSSLLRRAAERSLEACIRAFCVKARDTIESGKDWVEPEPVPEPTGEKAAAADGEDSAASSTPEQRDADSAEESMENAKDRESSSQSAASLSDSSPERAAAGDVPVEYKPLGSPAVARILEFACSLSDPHDQANSVPVRMVGLDLLALVLTSMGRAVGKSDVLLEILRTELSLMVVMNAYGADVDVRILSRCCSLILALFWTARDKMRVQFQVFLDRVFATIGEGKHVPVSLQEIALETLLDLCREPSFMADVFANYDCDVHAPNVFEGVCKMLSKNAFPVSGALNHIHTLSLEVLMAVVQSMVEEDACDASTLADEDEDDEYDVADADDTSGDASAVRHERRSGRRTSSESRSSARAPGGSQARAGKSAEGAGRHEPAERDADTSGWSVESIRMAKELKQRLQIAADHFNRDPVKGLEYLTRTHILSEPLDPAAVAHFFRNTPGLDKELVGQYLGEKEDFNMQVLKAFVQTFDFRGMRLDNALRMFLEAFRLPGEGQKIDRIMECLAAHFFEQGSGPLETPDSAHILCFSLIMLNTDHHNASVKTPKMTLQQFIRNNRGIMNDKDVPHWYLKELYDAITSNEIRMTDDAAGEITRNTWLDILRKARRRGEFALSLRASPSRMLDRDRFSLIWGPTVAAISVVFDTAHDEATLRRCASAFETCAQAAAMFRLEDVFDNLVTSLCKFTTLTSGGPADANAAVAAFGRSLRARLACVAVFRITRAHGAYLREGWRNVLDCILRLHRIGLLDRSVVESDLADLDARLRLAGTDAGGSGSARGRGSGASASPSGAGASSSASGASSSLPSVSSRPTSLFSSFSAYLTSGGGGGEDEVDQGAMSDARSAVDECEIDALLRETKFLENDSLVFLVKALIALAARPSEDDDVSGPFCLDLLTTVSLRNRDRIALLWPHVMDYFGSCLRSGRASASAVERAVVGLLRLCVRLMHKEEISAELLGSLELLVRLRAPVFASLAERVAAGLLHMVKANAEYIRTAPGWNVVFALLARLATLKSASATGFEAVTFLLIDCVYIAGYNFHPCLDCVISYAESDTGGVARSIQAVDLLLSLHLRVLALYRSATTTASNTPRTDAERTEEALRVSPDDLVHLWLVCLGAFRRLSADPREEVRNYVLISLQRALLSVEAAAMPVKAWKRCLQEILFPLLTDIINPKESGRDMPKPSENVLVRASVLLPKIFVHHLEHIRQIDDWGSVWIQIVELLVQIFSKYKTEIVVESVPESLKNAVFIMAVGGAFQGGDDALSLWNRTWEAAADITGTMREDVQKELDVNLLPDALQKELEQKKAAAEAAAAAAAVSQAPSDDAPEETSEPNAAAEGEPNAAAEGEPNAAAEGEPSAAAESQSDGKSESEGAHEGESGDRSAGES